MRTHDYDVGFGRPPKSHRFQKGQSGNPRGRKRKPRVGLARTIEKLLMEEVAVTDKGVAGKVPALQLILLQLLNKVSDGKTRANRALARYAEYARARPRPRSIDPGGAERYAQTLEDGFDPSAPMSKLRRKRVKSRKPGKLTVDERIQRMKLGLEPIGFVEGANAFQSSEIYQLVLQEPPTRPSIRPGRSRKGLFPNEILDLVLYSILTGKSGKGPPPTRVIVAIRRLIVKAVGGDVSSAILILDIHAFAEKNGDI